MKTFLPGQIKTDAQGDLALVVNTTQKDPQKYGLFKCPMPSKELTDLTDPSALASRWDLQRVYLGVSEEAIEKARELNDGLDNGNVTFDALDVMLVKPYSISNPSR